MRIKAFSALRPSPEKVGIVSAVPYDTVDTEEARQLAGDNPWSLLRISRPEIEFPQGTDIYSEPVYARAVENFAKFQKAGMLLREQEDSFYVYRQRMGRHEQTGLVACCHVGDYENNVIRKHEKTRADKENDRARHVKILRANTGPVFLAYRDQPEADRLIAAAKKEAPLFDFTAPDGIVHTVWKLAAGSGIADVFGQVPVCYIADGHHRAAAAARVGMEERAANPHHTGHEEYNWFLTVLFPASQLQILPYNRCVSDLHGRTPEQFLAEVKRSFTVRENAEPTPKGTGQVSMYLGGKWYGLGWEPLAVDADPVSRLDVSVLQDRLLEPVLGVRDPRTDKRIDFIGGIRGTAELARRVDGGKAAVAFSMYPVKVEQIMAIADAGRIMPPKSTWFEPKLRSGLLIHTF